MAQLDYAKLAREALAIAKEAGQLAQTGFRTQHQLEFKGAVDLVTEFDLRSETLIRERLAALDPSIPVIGEEKGGQAGDVTWYVDPIDGTTNYAHGHPFWAVSIGLVDARGIAQVGAVSAAALGVHWVGAVGHFAERNSEPCAPSTMSDLPNCLLATGFPYDRHTVRENNNVPEFSKLICMARGIRRCGSAALDLCLVADGTYDGYWEGKLAPWDIAGGVALVRAAGAVVTDFQGHEADVRHGEVIAANAELNQTLRETLESARRN